MPIQTVLTKGRVPVKIWDKLENVESQVLDQLTNASKLPFVFKHIAVMPDCHFGLGCSVGTVVATKGAIVPSFAGVDLGCGMMAVKTPLDHKQVCDKLPELRAQIERAIPVGHHGNSKISNTVDKWSGWKRWTEASDCKSKYKDSNLAQKARAQLGSLGGGNHFIEVCLDQDNNSVWVMLHSGSRYIGKELASRHINAAKGLMKQMLIGLPDPDLAYLPEATKEFAEYWADLQWCQGYAYQNRIEMMDRVMRQVSYLFNDKQPIKRLMEVNCHHNYIEREHHYGSNVLVTRKGAVRARKGDLGIIPGSMGTKSYIVKGLGLEASFHSCSHGAGRKMSRTAAKKRFTLDDFNDQTKNVECRRDAGLIDEIPGAYKDIKTVMDNQSDLVETVAILKQVLCVKG